MKSTMEHIQNLIHNYANVYEWAQIYSRDIPKLDINFRNINYDSSVNKQTQVSIEGTISVR